MVCFFLLPLAFLPKASLEEDYSRILRSVFDYLPCICEEFPPLWKFHCQYVAWDEFLKDDNVSTFGG